MNPWTQSSEVIAHCVRETETEIERLHELYFRIRNKKRKRIGGGILGGWVFLGEVVIDIPLVEI